MCLFRAGSSRDWEPSGSPARCVARRGARHRASGLVCPTGAVILGSQLSAEAASQCNLVSDGTTVSVCDLVRKPLADAVQMGDILE